MSALKLGKSKTVSIVKFLICGMLIGLGAVLPGVSGGVLCVIFGIYKPIMEFLSSPFKTFKKNMQILIPAIIGIGLGFVVVSKALSFLLDAYPNQSVCVFVGLIFGMLPSLFAEAGEKGNTRGSFVSLAVSVLITFTLLSALIAVKDAQVITITPNFGWYMFCGVCMALSIIVPGMSFSTLLMPLGLYTVLTDGIGNIDFKVLLPAGLGALITIILLSKAVSKLMEKYHSIFFHAIIGIVISAALVIIPKSDSVSGFITNSACLGAGLIISLLLDKFNSKIVKE